MKKCFATTIAIAFGVWNTALVGSISCTFLGFIWGFEDTWIKVALSVPLCFLVFFKTYKLSMSVSPA